MTLDALSPAGFQGSVVNASPGIAAPVVVCGGGAGAGRGGGDTGGAFDAARRLAGSTGRDPAPRGVEITGSWVVFVVSGRTDGGVEFAPDGTEDQSRSTAPARGASAAPCPSALGAGDTAGDRKAGGAPGGGGTTAASCGVARPPNAIRWAIVYPTTTPIPTRRRTTRTASAVLTAARRPVASGGAGAGTKAATRGPVHARDRSQLRFLSEKIVCVVFECRYGSLRPAGRGKRTLGRVFRRKQAIGLGHVVHPSSPAERVIHGHRRHPARVQADCRDGPEDAGAQQPAAADVPANPGHDREPRGALIGTSSTEWYQPRPARGEAP